MFNHEAIHSLVENGLHDPEAYFLTALIIMDPDRRLGNQRLHWKPDVVPELSLPGDANDQDKLNLWLHIPITVQ